MILKIGTRPSRLAVRQAEEVRLASSYPYFKIVPVWTKGDKDKITPLSCVERSNFFTAELESALLNGGIDAAVHSAKDLEQVMPKDLVIAALTKSISPYECLVSKDKKTLSRLPKGAVIGTSSVNRKESIVKYRSDLIVKDIRGDIEERLNKLDKGEFDAVIIAHAALIRLGLEDRISEILSPEVIEPHPLQGRLAVQVKKDRVDLIRIFRRIHAE